MTEIVETTIDLLRHGEPEGGNKFRGQSDDPLSATGWAQMRSSTDRSNDLWNLIVTSPLLRCSEFAFELNSQLNIPLKLEERFMEIGFGEWEGKLKDDIDPHVRRQFYDDPINNAPENAEGIFDFYERVVGAWDTLNQNNKGKRILLVTHAGVIRVLVSHVKGLKISNMFQLKFPFASRTTIKVMHSDSGIEQVVQETVCVS